jgi:hypothetical protein
MIILTDLSYRPDQVQVKCDKCTNTLEINRRDLHDIHKRHYVICRVCDNHVSVPELSVQKLMK